MTITNLNPESPIPSSATTGPAAPMKVLLVPIDRIEIVPDRDHRGVDVDLQDLLESIPTIGMLHPLLVLPERNGKYELLAGHRRLRAARQLGCTEVRVQVITLDELRTELATIHENLARKNLPPTEEGRQLARAKAIYEELHPDAAWWVAPRTIKEPRWQLEPGAQELRRARSAPQWPEQAVDFARHQSGRVWCASTSGSGGSRHRKDHGR